VHFLAEDQKDLVARFAKKGADKFEGLEFETTKLGNPILTGVSVRLECATTQTFDTYDHMLIIGKVQTLENSGKPPLLFLHSSLRNIGELKN
jgi:3-hydroxy-9,10-secoandrosta-1,3,5(10)-triene-9,17-dione monooxygenase reductase component